MTGDLIPVVDGQVEAFPSRAEQWRRADTRARQKRVHDAPAGSLDLDDTQRRYGVAASPGDCGYAAPGEWAGDPAAQLRTAYVRNPAWTAIGIVCPKCGALWLKP